MRLSPSGLQLASIRQELPIAAIAFVVVLEFRFIDFDPQAGPFDGAPFCPGRNRQRRLQDIVGHDRRAFVAALIAAVLILGRAITGIVFGARGWLLAVSARQPIALGLGGRARRRRVAGRSGWAISAI